MSSHGHTHRSGGAARVAALKRAASANSMPHRSHRPSLIDCIRTDSNSNLVDENGRAGGNAAHTDHEQVDIERIAMRLDGFEMYAFLASLVAGFSFGCLNDVDALPSLKERVPAFMCYTASLTFALSLVCSIFSGLYATCVFALCSLYSKTALAEAKDARMRQFLHDTARFRTRGFRMFILCLITFAINVVLLALMRLDTTAAVPTVGLGLAFIYGGLHDLKRVLVAASYIFMPKVRSSRAGDTGGCCAPSA